MDAETDAEDVQEDPGEGLVAVEEPDEDKRPAA